MLDLTQALRDAGVPVGISEADDAVRSLEHIDLADRTSFRAALAASIVKSEVQRPTFDTLFELYFGAGHSPGEEEPGAPGQGSKEEFIEELMAALGSGDDAALRDLARRAVTRFGRLERSRSKDWFSHYEVVRALELNTLAARMAAEQDTSGSGLERKLDAAEFERRLRRFREETLMETRRRVAQHRGPEAVAAYAVGPLPEDMAFLSATSDMTELRKAIRPLARKLATRISMKRRRASRGQLDVRRTIRHSLSSGGVPLDAHFRNRAPHRPEVFILCDLSSSVGRFSRFALMLTHAMSAQFSKIRSFAFVDTLDEVTKHFATEDFAEAVQSMNRDAKVVSGDGHSDYGASLSLFLDTYGGDVGPRTTLLVLGDARTNYRADNAWALRELAHKARHAYWLNPEPKHDWDTGDSVASRYAVEVDAMVEVRNLRQLETFIAKTL
ncbi:MAG TPA: VWA domain-containing protein [Actinomycetota bacterium]|nr:VWA domain-containing protein [Actinomycetota bacterium]